MFIQHFEPQGRLFRNVHYCYCRIHDLTGCLQRDHFKSACGLVIRELCVSVCVHVCVCVCVILCVRAYVCACVCLCVCVCIQTGVVSASGFITKEEAETYETTQCRYLKFWVPLMWANNIIARARREGRIETEFGLRMVLEVRCVRDV